MHQSILLLSCFAIFASVQCSSIITRSMIRMSDNPPSSNSTHNRLENEEKLALIAENGEYQQIFPPKYQEKNSSVQSRSLESSTTSSPLQRNLSLSDYSSTVKKSINNKTPTDSINIGGGNRYNLKQNRNTDIIDSNPKNPIKSNISSEELSKSYWEQYKKFSHDFFNSSNISEKAVNKFKRNQEFENTNVWDVMQRIYDCVWSSASLSCLQERVVEQIGEDSSSFIHLLNPQLPRFYQGENPFYPETETDNFYMDEGRKKLSKKLQLIVPLLMALKVTMLPALAVMALVSGKAFLMSLLSLGVALIAVSVNPAALSISKRHEIASQEPHPSDPLPNKYYYVM